MSGILILKDLNKGSTLKQGDKTELEYQLADGDGDTLNLNGKTATVRLVSPDFTTIGYEKTGVSVGQDNIVRFTIDRVIQARKYYVEIIVDDKYIFPSSGGGRILNIDKSSIGTDATIIELVGKEKIISEVVKQVENSRVEYIVDKVIAEVKDSGASNTDAYTKVESDRRFSMANHTHDDKYATKVHTHDNYVDKTTFENRLSEISLPVRHAPTGWTLDRSTTPWTIWFDNGCGIQLPEYSDNGLIYGYGVSNNFNLSNSNIDSYPLIAPIIKTSRGFIKIEDWKEKGVYTYWRDNYPIINPINDPSEFDFSKVKSAKDLSYATLAGPARVFYALGIWSEKDILELGAVKK